VAEGFWERELDTEETPPTVDLEGSGGEELLNPEAKSVLLGFATGGIVGALQALDRDTWDESDSPGVDDPEALRRAEESVARRSGPWEERRSAPGEDWVPVARHVGEDLVGGLQPVAVALQLADIPVGWDPYDPRDAPQFLPPVMGTPGRTFMLLVPASRVRDAREALADLPADDVTFLWPDAASVPAQTVAVRETIEAEKAEREAAEEAEYEERYGSPDAVSTGPTPVTAYGRLSDNARLQNMAQGRSTGCALGLLAAVALVIAGAAFALFAGIR
jgi:hypothetical protein